MKQTSKHLVGLVAFACQLALAQQVDPMKDAAQRAITTNPEVTARLNAFRAASDETDVARGAYFPRLDLSAEASRTRDRVTSRSPETQSMTTTGVALTATQLLWDGLSTQNQVDRLGHARLVRYFEFIDASELTALEAVRAYVDVARERRLVKLAEENYVQHKQVAEQIQSRFKAGVGRGVDLEQANARLALAESNLTTEAANLHDVTERYRRIVGSPPPAEAPLQGGNFDRGLPGAQAAALEMVAKRNAAVAAAVENFRSAQSQSREKDGAFHPRVEAKVRSGAGNNLDGVADQKRDTSAGLYLNWNLYNGGSDSARVRQSASLLNQAADARDKACRDARQTAAIAFNDVRKLGEQIGYLERHVSASEKARDAYRQQFDIGQRSLLDVLNAENELFSARRAEVIARHDLVLAKARSHSAASSLVAALGLTRAGNAQDEVSEARYWQAGDDAATRCPLSATDIALTPKGELDERARQQLGNQPTPMISNAAAPVTAQTSAAAPAAMAAPKGPAAAEAPLTTPVSQRLLDWSAAWSTKDVTRYLSFYDASFKPNGVSRSKWFANRTKLLRKDGPIELKISNVQRRTLNANQVETKFEQNYVSKDFKDKSQKTLVWKRSGSEWYIIKESNR
jgi:adhesin transport system outer membrane protein